MGALALGVVTLDSLHGLLQAAYIDKSPVSYAEMQTYTPYRCEPRLLNSRNRNEVSFLKSGGPNSWEVCDEIVCIDDNVNNQLSK